MPSQSYPGGRRDVAVHLRDEVVDRVEPLLAAQPLDEPHLDRLAVEVAVEVEHVGLEQRASRPPRRTSGGARARSRRCARRRRRRGTCPRRCRRRAGRCGSGTAHVRGREAELAAPPSPSTTTPRTSCGPAEQLGGGVDVARGEQLADAGRRVRHAARSRRRARPRARAPSTSKPSSAPMRCEQRDVAAAAGTRSGSRRRPPRAARAQRRRAPRSTKSSAGSLLRASSNVQHEAIVDGSRSRRAARASGRAW